MTDAYIYQFIKNDDPDQVEVHLRDALKRASGRDFKILEGRSRQGCFAASATWDAPGKAVIVPEEEVEHLALAVGRDLGRDAHLSPVPGRFRVGETFIVHRYGKLPPCVYVLS